MFNFNGRTWLTQYPSGRWGYNGDVPACLCYEAEATISDIMGGRVTHKRNGVSYTMKVRSSGTRAEAIALAVENGIVLHRALTLQETETRDGRLRGKPGVDTRIPETIPSW